MPKAAWLESCANDLRFSHWRGFGARDGLVFFNVAGDDPFGEFRGVVFEPPYVGCYAVRKLRRRDGEVILP